jgi:hypothetical protein
VRRERGGQLGPRADAELAVGAGQVRLDGGRLDLDLSRGPSGALAFQGCLAEGGASGCTPVGSLDGVRDVTVSPDGASVYATAIVDDSITHFARGAGGALAFQGCAAAGGAPGCTPVASLDGAGEVQVSPDSASVYTTATGANAVTAFARGAPAAPSRSRDAIPTAPRPAARPSARSPGPSAWR